MKDLQFSLKEWSVLIYMAETFQKKLLTLDKFKCGKLYRNNRVLIKLGAPCTPRSGMLTPIIRFLRLLMKKDLHFFGIFKNFSKIIFINLE